MDEVTKNLGIEEKKILLWDYLINQTIIFAKAQTSDKSNHEVLAKIGKSFKQQEPLEQINPTLKSFFRRRKALVESRYRGFTFAYLRNKSGNSNLHTDLFKYVFEKEQSNRIIFYQQRQFT